MAGPSFVRRDVMINSNELGIVRFSVAFLHERSVLKDMVMMVQSLGYNNRSTSIQYFFLMKFKLSFRSIENGRQRLIIIVVAYVLSYFQYRPIDLNGQGL